MKKQVLIAAVAATMASSAVLADISITGKMKVNYTNTDQNSTITNAIKSEADLAITGKTGDTTVYFEVNHDSADGVNDDSNLGIEDQWMSTKIGDVKLKAGTWNGSDTIISADSARAAGKWEASTTVAGVTVKADGTSDANKNITLSGDIAGVAVSYKIDDLNDDEVKLATTISGVSVAYHAVNGDSANTDKSSVLVSGSVNGVELSYARADADSSATISGDSYFGDVASFQTAMAAGDDIQGFGAKASLAGNTVQAKMFTMEDSSASADVDFTKFIVTRPLAGGTTLEVTYTDEDATGASNDKETFDVELAVKF